MLGMQTQANQRKKIHLLPESLINKIAAGEVVERPASVVKELVENSLDAGATRISITIEDGGRTLIRIADDGCGIPPEEATLAFSQHATSKVANVEDLFAITTMGFRGEALASIASVSHTTMVTRAAESQQGEGGGVRVEVKDAHVGQAEPCAAAVGTVIEVRDLFYSVPARRKFLKTDATEFSHIYEMVQRTALPHPAVAFTLTHNGRMALELPATSDHRMRVGEALGKELYSELLTVEFKERGIRVSGFAGQPSLARTTAKYQYVFLNGRYIRDATILGAMKEAYRGLIEPASKPVAILFIEMEPSWFDVNVHPQKTEVRFRNSGAVYHAVLAALREKLRSSDLTPQVQTEGRVEGEGGGASWHQVPPSSPQSAAPAPGIEETRKVIADFFRQPEAATQPSLHYGVETTPSPLTDPSRMTVSPPPPAAEDAADKSEARSSGSVFAADDAQRSLTVASQICPGGEAGRFVQLHNAYIVAETGDGILIIDQHALHERILYEELFARVTRGPLEGQRLLLPEVLPIHPRQTAALETVRPLLMELGIEITDFDAGSVAVHTFPSLLSKVSPQEFLRDILDKLMELGGSRSGQLTREELLHEVLDMASCKAAVKAGYPLSHDEIATLLARKEHVERSSNCPHGRPTTLRLTLNDLERQFKRK
ncbi:MAG: DNA mismatch repair endonuclease MutL [Phycisphaerales bacterium]|nr:DNA mismatch repair endonuclease MutL [Phycisphaerales bacterium]